ncbi:MAG: SDR family NAD(P)-dependent oxidoreductase [Anaerolineales bacterium]
MTERQIVLVTGPAGNLGSAVVRRFVEDKASLILIDHHKERLAERFPDLQDSPGNLLLPGIDLRDRQAVQQAVASGLEQFGRIDCLIHTVGGFSMGETVAELSDQTWQRMFDLNLTTLLNITRAVIPHMVRSKRGKIVTIGARPSFQGKARMSAYSAAKSAVLRLTESMSAELKSSGINANCLIPGTIDTPENRQAMPDADKSRWVSPASLAEVIHFLCSPAADDIHGSAIPVYGA